MKRCGIYLITHILTGRTYVGQSSDIARRWREHATGHVSSKGHLSAAIAKHGWPAFETRVIEQCKRGALNEAERRWIAHLNTQHPHGYNLSSGGGQGTVVSEVTRAKMSASKKGVPKSAEWRAKMSERQRNPENIARMTALARNQSAETRSRISAANSGRVRSTEVRQRISATKRAQNAALPKRVTSAEVKAKMSVSAKAWRELKRVAMASENQGV